MTTMVGAALAWSRHALSTSHTKSRAPRRVTGSTSDVDDANECPAGRPWRDVDGDRDDVVTGRGTPVQAAAAMASRCGVSHSDDASGSGSSCSSVS